MTGPGAERRWAGLVGRYITSLAVERRPAVAAALADLAPRPPAGPWWSTEAFTTLRHHAHQLGGSAGSVGYPGMGVLAGALDALALGLIAVPPLPARGAAAHHAQILLLGHALLDAMTAARAEDSQLLHPPSAPLVMAEDGGRGRGLLLAGGDEAFRRLCAFIAAGDGWVVSEAGFPPPSAVLLLDDEGGEDGAADEAAAWPGVPRLVLPLDRPPWPLLPTALLYRLRVACRTSA